MMLVRLFYAASAFLAVRTMTSWPADMRITAVNPLWPSAWLGKVGSLRAGIQIIEGGYLASSLVAMMLPRWRLARAAYFLLMLEYMAFVNGFGKINHDYHAWLFVAFILIFLPTRKKYDAVGVVERHRFLTVIWLAQVVVLLLYTLTGVWKVGYALHSLNQPRVSAFNLHSFSYTVASRLLETSQDTVLGSYFVRNPLPGWALFNGTMYLETASLLIAFRPRLHRIWGFGLILFHIGTFLALGFTFWPNVFLVGLLFIASPVAPERVDLRAAALDLPGIYFLSNRIRHRPIRRRSRRAASTAPT